MWECQAVAARSDSPSVGRYDDEHLRRFLAARKAGDVAAMRTWWEELLIDFTDRMNGLVMANHKGRLDHAERRAELTAGERAGVAVLVRPTSAATVLEVAARGVLMPRKSTFFVPKPRTGLVMRCFVDEPDYPDRH